MGNLALSDKTSDFKAKGYTSKTQSSGRFRILHGDSTDPQILEKESVDLIVASPPYNVSKPYDGTADGDAVSYDDYTEFSKA